MSDEIKNVSSREVAYKILLDVNTDGAYSNLALKKRIKDYSPSDKALITRLVYGCLSMKLNLDYIISKFSSVKLKKISNKTIELLRIGVYQIMYMDKIPDSAAVNESVKLSKKYAVKSRGFINAVLRAVADNKDKIEYPKEENEYLSVKYSFPLSLCKRLKEDFGDRAEEIIKSLCSEPSMIIRANRLKISADELLSKLENAERIDGFPDAISVSGLDVSKSEDYKNGLFTVQDTAAQLACLILNPKKNEKVIDLCAAPGGKTTYLAELMENKGSILAFDIHPHKTELIMKNAKRVGADIISAEVSDSTEKNEKLKEFADKILADVPCSGLGILRRKPEIKWAENDISSLPEIQAKILENAIYSLKPGGELVYSTCTILSCENIENVRGVLKNHPEMELVDFSEDLPKGFEANTASEGYLTLLPSIHKTDGFFICKLRKRND